MCPLGRVGSSPTLGTKGELLNALAFFVPEFGQIQPTMDKMMDIGVQTNS